MPSKRTPPKGRPARRRPPRAQQRRSRIARKRASLAAVVAVSVAVVSGVLVLAVRGSESSEKGNVSATAFDLPRLNAQGRVRLATLTQRPTILNFFASWCTACDAELPDFRRAADALEGKVNFVFVNSNESGDWHPMAERNGILRFTLAKDINGTAGNGLYRSLGGTGGMPITGFYDARGKLIDVSYGALTGGLLNQKLQQHYGVRAA